MGTTSENGKMSQQQDAAEKQITENITEKASRMSGFDGGFRLGSSRSYLFLPDIPHQSDKQELSVDSSTEEDETQKKTRRRSCPAKIETKQSSMMFSDRNQHRGARTKSCHIRRHSASQPRVNKCSF